MKSIYTRYFILILILFFAGCAYYYPFLSDDSLISLRYVQRFLDGKGLSWNDGHPVEGYSNLLWILLISVLGKIDFDLIFAARLLGIIFSLGTISVIFFHCKNRFSKPEVIFLPILLLFTTPSFVVWAIGGLEQPLYIFLLALILSEVSKIQENNNLKRLFPLSIWLGLLTITRPDGFLFTGITTLFLILTNLKRKSNILKVIFTIGLIPILFLIGQLIFRYNYYGELVPNTALVKVKFTMHHILGGGFYNVKAFFGTFLLSMAGLCSLYILIFKKKNPFALYIFLSVSAWILYITSVGGDIFPAFRQYYVAIIFFIFAIILGLKQIHFNIKNKYFNYIVAGLLIINVFVQILIPSNMHAKDERWEFKGLKLGENLKKTFPKNSLLGVTVAGSIPYASEFPTVDMLGLNDYYIPRHPPKNFGNGFLAHELGDAKYIMQRNPDIIIFHTGNQMDDVLFNATQQLKENSDFRKNFVAALIKDESEEYILYFNKYSKKTGVKFNSKKIEIPGYLFSADKNSAAIFKQGKIFKILEPEKKYSVQIDAPTHKDLRLSLVNVEKNDILDVKTTYTDKDIFVEITTRKKTFLNSLILEYLN